MLFPFVGPLGLPSYDPEKRGLGSWWTEGSTGNVVITQVLHRHRFTHLPVPWRKDLSAPFGMRASPPCDRATTSHATATELANMVPLTVTMPETARPRSSATQSMDRRSSGMGGFQLDVSVTVKQGQQQNRVNHGGDWQSSDRPHI